jgi:hypothetical protein
MIYTRIHTVVPLGATGGENMDVRISTRMCSIKKPIE